MSFPDPKRSKYRDNGGLQTLIQAEKLMQIAIMLPTAVVLGWALGSWADKAFHQSWISIVGILLGGAGGLSYVVRLVLNAGKGSL